MSAGSKTDLVTLALIWPGSLHVYGFRTLLEMMELDQWAQVSAPTVYRAIGRLEAAGFLQVVEERVGNAPPRRLCTLTDAGREELRRLTRAALADREWGSGLFELGMCLCFALTAEEVLPLLAERRRALARVDEECLQKMPFHHNAGIESACIMLRYGRLSYQAMERAAQEWEALLRARPLYFAEMAMGIQQLVQRGAADGAEMAVAEETSDEA